MLKKVHEHLCSAESVAFSAVLPWVFSAGVPHRFLVQESHSI